MKKIVAMILLLALAFPSASLLAQQAPTQVKQPVQVAQGGPLEGFSLFGMGVAGSVALVVVAVVAVAVAVDDNNDDPLPVTATSTR